MNIYFDLFLTFAKVGVCTFGGGYAMLPILQREVVEKKGWATDGELTDYFAVGQCTPGIIAVNTATFIGFKYKGIPGGILATLGVVFPSLIIITAIAAFLSNFADIPMVRHALAGINAAVVALIASSVVKLGKSTLKNGAAIAIFLCVLVLAAAGSLTGFGTGTLASVMELATSPAVLIVLAGLTGWLVFGLGKKGGAEK
ncbi:MAG: chromate transporter [Lawsonibacter sp.]|uniref:chromate transporter n=1 Tax=Lawsonibacter sp. JLR.KK007 TaxID=3114293 RepID=UPI002172629F|nr:chromate transporter [Lawsonibacter sp.]MCI8990940.1 chromate transporter [Lawsonibacter sp.]MCI9269272.1 chromate transporter [Lawsonibacter sp.]